LVSVSHVSGDARSTWPFFLYMAERPHQYLLKAGISIDKCLEITPATGEHGKWRIEPPEPPPATMATHFGKLFPDKSQSHKGAPFI